MKDIRDGSLWNDAACTDDGTQKRNTLSSPPLARTFHLAATGLATSDTPVCFLFSYFAFYSVSWLKCKEFEESKEKMFILTTKTTNGANFYSVPVYSLYLNFLYCFHLNVCTLTQACSDRGPHNLLRPPSSFVHFTISLLYN
ncbi:hypothetical protein CDAR_36311 [Caerostris darwini]|uniref:Uncharacterized protein n=1 Tax=Caerostris darwini TaxID=1538125 RepID=A0AAV4R690_9ARAC|nr:hypothetical protein CDAR_36311 [Caerostris darwini]